MEKSLFNLSSSQISLIKWLALITMLFDHIGYLFFNYETLSYTILRSIGRFSFLAFCFLIVYQIILDKTVIQKYVSRLSILTLVSQYPYMIFSSKGRALEAEWSIFPLSPIGTLLAIVLLLGLGDILFSTLTSKQTFLKAKNSTYFIFLSILFLFSIRLGERTIYGFFGILFGALLYIFLVKLKCYQKVIQDKFMLLTSGKSSHKFNILIITVLIVLPIMLVIDVVDNKYHIAFLSKLSSLLSMLILLFSYLLPRINIPRIKSIIFYSFYPIHLLILTLFFVIIKI